MITVSELAPFWEEVRAEADAVPLNFRRERISHLFPVPHVVDRLWFNSVGGREVSGWFAYPEGARRVPSFVWVPPYGRESLLPNAYGTREGVCSLSMNLHGEDAFHQEKYRVERGYFADGILEPETWIFKTLIQHVLVSLRVLQAQSEADETQIGIMGMSQGAGLTLWAAANSNIPVSACADMPFLGRISSSLLHNVYRYPLKEVTDFADQVPLGLERIKATLEFFDTANVAQMVKVPTHVSLGEKDPACKPDTVRAIYDAIPTEKALVEYPGGHDWDPEMVKRNLDWLLRFRKS